MADLEETVKTQAVKAVKWWIEASVLITGTLLAVGEDPSEVISRTEAVAWATDWFVLVESVMRALLGGMIP
jgi:hypothetical protein